MKTFRYLNAVLTVIAVLLTLNLWTLWTMGPSANGPVIELASTAQAQGLTNAGAQRRDMINLMKQQVAALKDLSKTLKSGEVRVRLEGGK